MSDPKKDKKDKKKDKDKKKPKDAVETEGGEGEDGDEAKSGDEQEGAEGAEGDLDLDGGKKKGIKPLFLIIGAVVLLIVAGAGVYFSGLLDPLLGKTETEEHAAEDGEHKVEKKKDAHGKKKESGGHGKKKEGGHGGGGEEGGSAEGFMPLPDLIVNLSSNQGAPRYLKLKVQLELEDPADQSAIEAVAPRVIDHFQTYLRELRISDLRGSAGIYRLRQELLARVNAAADPVVVKDVLFQEILIQ